MEINRILLGTRIRELRKMKNLSQEELAEMADLSAPYMCYIENGRRKASLDTVCSIAIALEVSVDEILTGNKTSNPTEYSNEMLELLSNCSNYEKRIIFESSLSIKKSLKAHKDLFNKDESEHNILQISTSSKLYR